MSEKPDRAERLVRWLIRRRVLVLVLAALFAGAGGARTVLTYAALRSDLEELLPTSAPSVAALKTLRGRLPGLRHLGVVVETGGPANVSAANRFLDALAERIRAYGPDTVEDVRVGVAAEREFAETYALQLMDPSDVVTLRKAVEERRDWEVSRGTGTDLFLDDEPPEIPFEALRKKYAARYGGIRDFPGDRFVSPEGKYAVLIVQASSTDTGLGADEALLTRVRKDIHDLGFPQAFAPGMRVGFAGDVPTRVEEMEGLVADLSLSGALVGLLVIGVIVLFFGSARALPILGIPLITGTLCTFGIVALPPLAVRHLNSNTAFLGSIVIGNGINTGIILLARYTEERGRGSQILDAAIVAVRTTWRPTLAAAAAASAAYGSLVFTDFRGFNQFGWIGGFGMLLCWLSTMLVAPPLISLVGAPIAAAKSRRSSRPSRAFGGLAVRAPRAVLVVTGVLFVASLGGMWLRSADWLETDFSKLRRRDSWTSGERYWGGRMDKTLGRYLTPTVVLAANADDAHAIYERLKELKAKDAAGGLIATVRDADAILPPKRAESLREARVLKKIVTPRLEKRLGIDEREKVQHALSDSSMKLLEAGDIPNVLAAGLREKNGQLHRNVLIFPKLTTGTWNASRMGAFAHDVRRAASEGLDEPAPVAGSLLLSSDIVDAMKSDGPRATAIALGVVVLIAAVAFRSWMLSMAAVSSLLVGVTLMLGALAWGGLRFNFSNFVALPITFGIAADYSINMLKRYQLDREDGIDRAVTNTGGAVALCSATTIIGFGSLLVAQNQALFSFGVFAVAGEIACLATAVWALPALLFLSGRRATNGRGEQRGVSSLPA